MGRLKVELESCYAEDRAESLQQAQAESMQEIEELTKQFNAKEKELRTEVDKYNFLLKQNCNTRLFFIR